MCARPRYAGLLAGGTGPVMLLVLRNIGGLKGGNIKAVDLPWRQRYVENGLPTLAHSLENSDRTGAIMF